MQVPRQVVASHSADMHGPRWSVEGCGVTMECRDGIMESGEASNSNNILIVFLEVQKGWKPELADTSD